jgi:sugar/nucleoside kinase (ribokinase family)
MRPFLHVENVPLNPKSKTFQVTAITDNGERILLHSKKRHGGFISDDRDKKRLLKKIDALLMEGYQLEQPRVVYKSRSSITRTTSKRTA